MHVVSASKSKTITSVTGVPFDSAEQAWFWFIRCQKMRNDGASYCPSKESSPRPCDPDDLYRIVRRLHQNNRLSDEHLSVLSKFGVLECPPDARHGPEQRAARVWDEAMDRMLSTLMTKGIVVIPQAKWQEPTHAATT